MTDSPANTPATSSPDQEFWKRKLLAFLHDPPDKCFDIGRHEDSATTFQSGAGFTIPDECQQLAAGLKPADHFASAADRFVFPKGKCATTYTGQSGASFIHPLSSTQYHAPANLAVQAGHLHEILKDAVGGIHTNDWQVRFFLYWRRWLENAATTDKQNAEHLAFSPGDSRLPDHTIWNHMSVTSAVAGCLENGKVRPAMLLFQLGPVQEFIAQARSTRDLWSGSYLLSWLMAHAMKAVSDRVGPDAIIFPNLRGNGIFDALHRTEMYAALFKDRHGTEMSLWQRLLHEKGADRDARWLLTPTLPNRFLALVPTARAEPIAQAAATAIRDELGRIGAATWSWVATEAGKVQRPGLDNWKARWNAQIAAFPQITWAVQPWLERDACMAEFARLPVNQPGRRDVANKPLTTPLQRLQDMLDLAERWLPVDDRDPRYYADSAVDKPKEGKTRLNNPGAFWAAHYALVDAQLAARRNTRDFASWSNPFSESAVKDSLSGKEECIGDEDFWKHLVKEHPSIFTSAGHRYGAMNLIKRLWCRSDKVPYLREKIGVSDKDFGQACRFETVQAVACMNKAKTSGKDEHGDPKPGNPYVALLAMDGDEMGKWVSGEKTPEFLLQISEKARNYLEPILQARGKTDVRRLLTPSYHLQFSEALANFSTWLAEPVVEAFDGQLIYSGGDDVLAMLPADQAIACAEALRAVFRGEAPPEHSRFHLAVTQTGYAKENAGYPLIVPGPAADVSVGLAIGHCKAPLQMLVREAQRAEKQAKSKYQRGALAVSLYKRSGEIIEWGCKWDAPAKPHGADAHGERVALQLMRRITELSSGEQPQLTGRFPYALAALLEPYALERKPDIDAATLRSIILNEFEHVVSRQASGLSDLETDQLHILATTWLSQLDDACMGDFAKLFLVETFINRHRGED